MGAEDRDKGFMAGGWAFWVLILLVPLVFVPDSVDPYASIRWGILALANLGLLLPGIRRWRAAGADLDPVALLALAAFTAAGIVSALAALHPLEAAWDVARWLMVGGLMLGLAQRVRAQPSLQQHAWRAGIVATLVLAGLRLLQGLGVLGGLPEGGDLAAATLGNVNFFDGAMVMLAALNTGAILAMRGIWRILGGVGLAVAVVCVIEGLTTGSLLALGAVAATLLDGLIVLRWPQGKYAHTPWLRPTLMWGAVLAGIAGFVWVLSWDTPVVTASSAVERVIIWKKSAQMIADSPIVGVGPGHWHYHILRHGVVSSFQGFATRYFMEAHNDYLHLLAERGVLGGLAFMLLLGTAWRNGWRHSGAAPLDGARLSAVAGLAAWMVFAVTNLPGEQAYHLGLLCVFMAPLLRRQPQAPGLAWAGKLGMPLLAAATTAAVVLLPMYGLWIKAERTNFILFQDKVTENWGGMAVRAKAARTWYNWDDRVSGTPIAWYEGAALLHMNAPAQGVQLLEVAKEVSPWHPQVGSMLGAGYYLAGDGPRAIAELQDLVTRFEAFDEARMNLTEIYMGAGQYDKAAETIAYWRIHAGSPANDNYYNRIDHLLDSLGVVSR